MYPSSKQNVDQSESNSNNETNNEFEAQIEAVNMHYQTKLQPALQSLSRNESHIGKVHKYCASSFRNAKSSRERDEIESQTTEYVRDIVGAVSNDISNVTETLQEYMNLQRNAIIGGNDGEGLAGQIYNLDREMENISKRKF